MLAHGLAYILTYVLTYVLYRNYPPRARGGGTLTLEVAGVKQPPPRALAHVLTYVLAYVLAYVLTYVLY